MIFVSQENLNLVVNEKFKSIIEKLSKRMLFITKPRKIEVNFIKTNQEINLKNICKFILQNKFGYFKQIIGNYDKFQEAILYSNSIYWNYSKENLLKKFNINTKEKFKMFYSCLRNHDIEIKEYNSFKNLVQKDILITDTNKYFFKIKNPDYIIIQNYLPRIEEREFLIFWYN